MRTIGRRDFLTRGGKTALVVLAAPSLLAACGESGPDCNQATPEQQSARLAAHYLDHTTSGARNCANCTFFTEGAPHACGTCAMNMGLVNPMGVCDRFAARA